MSLILREHGINVGDKNLGWKIYNENTDQVTRGTPRDSQNNLVDTYSTLMGIDCTSRDTYGISNDGTPRGIIWDAFSTSGDSRSTFADIDSTSRDASGTLRCTDGRDTNTTSSALKPTDGTSRNIRSTLRETHSTSKDNNGVIDRTSMDTGGTLGDKVSTSGDIVGTSWDTVSTSRDINGSQRDTDNSLHGNINGFEGSKQDAELWTNVEHLMLLSENEVKTDLQRNGIFGEDLVEDEDGEEGQLWKVLEGKRPLSDVV